MVKEKLIFRKHASCSLLSFLLINFQAYKAEYLSSSILLENTFMSMPIYLYLFHRIVNLSHVRVLGSICKISRWPASLYTVCSIDVYAFWWSTDMIYSWSKKTSISKLLSIPIVLPRNMLRKSSFVENCVYKIQFWR